LKNLKTFFLYYIIETYCLENKTSRFLSPWGEDEGEGERLNGNHPHPCPLPLAGEGVVIFSWLVGDEAIMPPKVAL
jgi:hypothetical protein